MKLAFIGEAAPAFIESGQVAASQSNPEEFNQAMTAVLALLKTPLPNAAPVNNNNSTEFARGGFKRVPLPVIGPEATVSEKRAVRPQEPEQLDYEEITGPVEGMYTPAADVELSKYLPAGQVQEPTKVVTADSEYQSQQPETSPAQLNIIGGQGESGMNSPLFTGILPLEEDHEQIQLQVMPELTSPGANEFINSRETDATLVTAELNQIPASSPKSDTVGESGSEAVLNQVAAFASAKGSETFSGQEVSLLDRTVNEAAAASNPIPLFAQSDREPVVAPGQVYNSVSAAKDTTVPENTTFTRLEKPVMAQRIDTALYEAAPVFEDSQVFEDGSPAAITARAETAAAAPDQVSKVVLPDSPPAAGQVLTGQEPAVGPAGETRTSGEVVKSAGKEEIVFTGKAETPAASAAVETKSAKTDVEPGLGAVNNRQTAAGQTPEASVILETDTPLVKAEQNQVSASDAKNWTVGESLSSPVFSQVEASGAAKWPVAISAASGSAKEAVISSGQDVLQLAGTVKQTAAANVNDSAPLLAETPEITVISSGVKASESAQEPVMSSGQDLFLFDQSAREPAVALDQVYNSVWIAKETTGTENTTFTRSGKPVVAQRVDTAVYEAALTVGDSPVFEAGSPAATTARAETAAAVPDQLLKAVLPDSPTAAGQVVTGQEPAVAPAGETSTSSESGPALVSNMQKTAGQTPGASVTRETDTPLVKVEQNQVLSSGPKSGIVEESVSSALFSQKAAVFSSAEGPVTISAASKSAKETAVLPGQEAALPTGTLKTTVADVLESAPIYTQAAEETVIASKSAKETAVLPGQEAALPTGTLKTTVADVLESAPIYTQAAEETVIASKSAKETVVLPGQEAALPTGTLKTTVADALESAPMYAQAVREPAVASRQVYNAVTAMAKDIEPENITFASLKKPATVRQRILFEKALAVGDSPVFEAGSTASTTARAEAAASPNQVLKSVLPGSPPVAGQVVTGQEPAASPALETGTSGEAVKSAGIEEIPAAGLAVDKDAAITGGKGAGGEVENTTPNNVSQYDSVSSMSNSVDNQKTVKLADMRDTLVQEIKRAYYQQKSEPLTQVDLKLEPEHLGKLTIKLFFNGGELNAHFYAGNDYVKDVLEGSIQQLRQTLDQQDLKLNQAFVFVGDDGRNGTGQSESGGRQPARYSGAYSGHTYGDIAPEPAVYEPSGHSYKMVNYLI